MEPQTAARVVLTDMLANELANSLASDFVAIPTDEVAEKLSGNSLGININGTRAFKTITFWILCIL